MVSFDIKGVRLEKERQGRAHQIQARWWARCETAEIRDGWSIREVPLGLNCH